MTNLIKITITDALPEVKSGVKNGKDWQIREQKAVLETTDRRQPIRLDLGKSEPYPPGEYTLDLNANLNISQFGSVQLRRNLELVPVQQPAKLAAAR